jgi:hypothetical protein
VDNERKIREEARKDRDRERKKVEEIPLLEFLRHAVEVMVVVHSETYSNPPFQSVAAARLALENLQAVHYNKGPQIIFKSQLYRVCKACKKRFLYHCERCEVALHPDCFLSFHKKEEQY